MGSRHSFTVRRNSFQGVARSGVAKLLALNVPTSTDWLRLSVVMLHDGRRKIRLTFYCFLC